MQFRPLYLILMLSLCVVVSAQPPQRFSYQSVVRNASNALLSNQPVGMRISILQGSGNGTAVYVETHTVTTTANGQVNVEIGGGTVVTGTMAGINWSNGSYFVKTETDPAGGTNYSIIGTSQLHSVPYALIAGNGVGNGTMNSQIMYWNGTAWVTLNPGANGQVLTVCNGVLTWTTGGQCPAGPSACPPENVFNASIMYGTVSDQDGNVYKTVTVGSKVWMAENLRARKYQNGDPIPLVSNATLWASQTTGGICWYNNDSSNYHCRNGMLYNWFSVADSRNICPSGWHVPSDQEWNQLIGNLDPGLNSAATGSQSASAGGKLKTTGFQYWSSPNQAATNSIGFSALPSGYRAKNGTYDAFGGFGYWWTSTSASATNAWYRNCYYNDGSIYRYPSDKSSAHSIRCVKD